MKNLAYIRVSTSDQSTSLEVQREKILNYCKFKGLDEPEFLIDEDISGKLPILYRPEGAKLTGAKNANIISVKLDRLFRNVIDALTMREEWEKQNVSIHLVDMGGNSINTSSAIGIMLFTQMASYGEFERRIIGERTSQALQHKKSNLNKYSCVPLGFKQVKIGTKSNGDPIHNIEENGEMPIVNRIFELYKTTSYLGIAKILNEDGVKTKNDKKWYASTISYILNNKLYQK